MTSKEKAEELASKFKGSTDVIVPNQASIKYAKICVQEIMETSDVTRNNGKIVYNRNYWQEVLNYLNEM